MCGNVRLSVHRTTVITNIQCMSYTGHWARESRFFKEGTVLMEITSKRRLMGDYDDTEDSELVTVNKIVLNDQTLCQARH